MNKTNLDLYKHINPNKLPKVWFDFYVVHKFSWGKNTYIVGFNSDLKADIFQKEILMNKDIIRCEIFGHYPLELLKEENSDELRTAR